nr:retrovirus-related Pol polyprotein from transposon TNT 1-94 [Tanacetum cinerariifolium]
MLSLEIIERINNGNKVLKRTVRTVKQVYEPTFAEEKLIRRNEMKARGTLLMALLNKDQLKFHSYQDAKLLMEAIEKRYGGNKESKKESKNIQMTLLKQQYENFVASSSETLDQTFVRLQKLISQLEIQGEVIHTSSTNEADNTAYGVNTTHTQGNTIKSTSVDNLSDAVICAFLASQPNSPQLSKEDLEQIDPDDLEEMDLHWKMAMLTIRARREYRALKNQENRGKEYGRKTMPVKSPSENALIAQDRIGGYDWSYQAEEEHPTNYALMVLTSFESSPGLDSETVESKHESIDVKSKSVYSTVKTKPVMKNIFSPPIIEDWNSNDEIEIEIKPKVEVKTVRPGIEQIKFVKTARETVEIVETPKQHKHYPMGNQRNWNNLMVKDTTAGQRAVLSGNMKKEQKEYKEKGVIDSGCSRNMTGTNAILLSMKTMTVDLFLLEMVNVEFLEKLLDESQVLLRVPRKDNIYSVDLKSVVPTGGLTFLFAKATIDESNLWHRRNRKSTRLCDSETEFKNSVMNQFCDMKGIKREYIVARTPQQNRVAERKNITLIEAARTMLVDSKLPTTFWAETINTTCYVLNRALVTKPHNKTPYELIRGRPPLIDFMNPFGCLVTILNTRDYLGKFEGKADEGFFCWVFDIDSLTISMNYVPVAVGNQTNGIAGTRDNLVAGPKDSVVDDGKKATKVDESEASNNGGEDDQITRSEFERLPQQERQIEHFNSTNSFNTISSPVSTVGPSFANAASPSLVNAAGIPAKEEVDMNNVDSSYTIPHDPLTKFLKDNPKNQMEPKKPVQALKDPSWVEAMQDELLQNKKDEKRIVVMNKARLVAQGHTQEEVYQIDVKSAFLYGKIEEEKSDGIFIIQDKYVAEILKKFDFATVKKANALMEPNKPLIKDEEAEDVDVHLYRSMIGSFMYLTGSRPDITFAVCACARPMYPKDSPFDLEDFSDSDYAGASIDRKSTTRDETVHKEKGDIMERAATTASSLEVEHNSEKPTESKGFEKIIDFLNAQPIRYTLTVNPTVYALCVKHFWATAKVTKVNGQEQIQSLVDKQKVIITEESIRRDLQFDDAEAKADQAKKIAHLKKRAKKLENRRKSRPAGLRRLKKVGRMHDDDMFGVNDLKGDVVIVDVIEKSVEKEVSTAKPVTIAGEVVTATNVEVSTALTTITTANVDDELTLVKTLIAIKVAKLKVILTAATTVTTAITTLRAKGIIFMNKLQAREREEFLDVQKARLLVELIEKRRKHFAALRAQEKRNIPPTKSQMKSQMSTYVKNIGGYKHSQLKGKSFDEIKTVGDTYKDYTK